MLSDDDMIPATQSQAFQGRSSFNTHISPPSANAPRNIFNTPVTSFMDDLYADDDETDESNQVRLIDNEIDRYKTFKFTKEDKLELNVLEWW